MAGSDAGDDLGERREGDGLGERADPTRPDAVSAGHGHERTQVAQAEALREGVGDARDGVIGVGVGAEERDAVRDERVEEAALVVDGGHGVHAGQQERMVRDDQVGLQDQGLVDDLGDGIDSEQDAAHGGVRVAARQAHGIPVGGELGRVALLEHRDDVADGHCGGHAVRLPTGALALRDR